MLTLDSIVAFTWCLGGPEFFLESDEGNYIWSDPEYNGDNTIRPFEGNCKAWCKYMHIPFGRDKGKHTIREYCGDQVKILE